MKIRENLHETPQSDKSEKTKPHKNLHANHKKNTIETRQGARQIECLADIHPNKGVLSIEYYIRLRAGDSNTSVVAKFFHHEGGLVPFRRMTVASFIFAFLGGTKTYQKIVKRKRSGSALA